MNYFKNDLRKNLDVFGVCDNVNRFLWQFEYFLNVSKSFSNLIVTQKSKENSIFAMTSNLIKFVLNN